MALRCRSRTLNSNCETHDQNSLSESPSSSRTTGEPNSFLQRARTLSLPETLTTSCHSVDGALTGFVGTYSSGSWATGGSHRYSRARDETSSTQIGVSGERSTWLRKSIASLSVGSEQTKVRVWRGRGKALKFAPVITASEP